MTNREEIWQAIHQALEVLWTGGDPEDNDGGLSTAQAILDAANVTLPTGDIARGAYDTFGNHYKLPRHIVSNPTNLQPDLPVAEDVHDDSEGPHDEDKGSEVDDKEELQRRREEKGKAPMRPQDEMTIRAKLSDRENRPLKLTIGKQDTVRAISRKLFELSEVSQISLSFVDILTCFNSSSHLIISKSYTSGKFSKRTKLFLNKVSEKATLFKGLYILMNKAVYTAMGFYISYRITTSGGRPREFIKHE